MAEAVQTDKPVMFNSRSGVQALTYAAICGILYWIVAVLTSPSMGLEPTATQYLGGFAIIAIIAFASWRWTEFMLACWLGVLFAAPMSSTLTGAELRFDNGVYGLAIISAVYLVPFFLFLLPPILRWMDERNKSD
jgi:hypothetical protein